ncbi:MAG TPA: hypothetical protein VLL05_16225 [Terriglobales bacterium]|nr:hypothetical protein [Terriglobales bacterium]
MPAKTSIDFRDDMVDPVEKCPQPQLNHRERVESRRATRIFRRTTLGRVFHVQPLEDQMPSGTTGTNRPPSSWPQVVLQSSTAENSSLVCFRRGSAYVFEASPIRGCCRGSARNEQLTAERLIDFVAKTLDALKQTQHLITNRRQRVESYMV